MSLCMLTVLTVISLTQLQFIHSDSPIPEAQWWSEADEARWSEAEADEEPVDDLTNKRIESHINRILESTHDVPNRRGIDIPIEKGPAAALRQAKMRNKAKGEARKEIERMNRQESIWDAEEKKEEELNRISEKEVAMNEKQTVEKEVEKQTVDKAKQKKTTEPNEEDAINNILYSVKKLMELREEFLKREHYKRNPKMRNRITKDILMRIKESMEAMKALKVIVKKIRDVQKRRDERTDALKNSLLEITKQIEAERDSNLVGELKKEMLKRMYRVKKEHEDERIEMMKTLTKKYVEMKTKLDNTDEKDEKKMLGEKEGNNKMKMKKTVMDKLFKKMNDMLFLVFENRRDEISELIRKKLEELEELEELDYESM